MTTLEITLAILGSSVGGGIITQLGSIAMEKLRRKYAVEDKMQEREDKKDTDTDKILSELSELKTALLDHIKEDHLVRIGDCRRRILRFCDEEKNGIGHTQEHWNEILSDITKYNRYCDTHEDYPNQKAVSAIEYITNLYQQRLKNNNFL